MHRRTAVSCGRLETHRNCYLRLTETDLFQSTVICCKKKLEASADNGMLQQSNRAWDTSVEVSQQVIDYLSRNHVLQLYIKLSLRKCIPYRMIKYLGFPWDFLVQGTTTWAAFWYTSIFIGNRTLPLKIDNNKSVIFTIMWVPASSFIHIPTFWSSRGFVEMLELVNKAIAKIYPWSKIAKSSSSID